jgi:hypothetical protein
MRFWWCAFASTSATAIPFTQKKAGAPSKSANRMAGAEEQQPQQPRAPHTLGESPRTISFLRGDGLIYEDFDNPHGDDGEKICSMRNGSVLYCSVCDLAKEVGKDEDAKDEFFANHLRIMTKAARPS